ncbi:MAG TPA: sulfate adenylyltransferase subunit CysN [Bryobacteraceae bacterium]|jgi:sulfate adenylyltransferase large subunit|nr:sulfate adenylyltransferase subunit CysN [Bryobacteraceae bacterium]
MAADPVCVERRFDVEQFLAEEQRKDLLRFTTAGSVDDGKSTLIGRLLYDSRSVYEDQIHAIRKSTVNRSAGDLDLSLLTDGLRAEREQGITIDVAYRYFATAKRKFIIADTPGHEQYTRNMATGASTADLAIILIDARNGVQAQSRRHAYIAALLGIPQFVIAVNKMDLVGYDQNVFHSIREEFTGVLRKLGVGAWWFVPISALKGDNVVRRSGAMPWFDGPSLLEYLETVEIARLEERRPFRFPVQRVIRPDQGFRGYAGQVASGSIRPGDEVFVLPSGRSTRIKSIETFDGPLTRAFAPMSVTLTLEDEIDVSRGDMIVAADRPAPVKTFDAHAVWLSERPLDPARPYLLKHTTQTVHARVRSVDHRINLQTLEREPSRMLELNGIGQVRVETTRPIFADPYKDNRVTGAAILIDPETNATAGALMISRIAHDAHGAGPVTAAERSARYGHPGGAVRVGLREGVALLLERRLFDRGALPLIVREWNSAVESAARAVGALAIIVDSGAPPIELPRSDEAAAEALLSWLQSSGMLRNEFEVTGGEGI